MTGTIVPASCEGDALVASTEEGDTSGQTEVMKSSSIRRLRVEPHHAAAPTVAVEALENADLILIGPGSSTSVLAACVVPGILPALAGTTARKVDVANLDEQVPDTEGYTLQDHVDALVRHGVVPAVMLVNEGSRDATPPCSLVVHTRQLVGENRRVHDVQKLSEAVFAQCEEI